MKVEYIGIDSSDRRDYRITCGPDDLPPLPLGHLIAAAPELYEALKDMLLWCIWDTDYAEQARKAIAKAEAPHDLL